MTKSFTNYTKTLVQFNNNSKVPPDYLYLDLHRKTTKSTTAHLIVYGIEGHHSSVDPAIYDSLYSVDTNKTMVMNTNINMNNHKITNLKKS